MLELLPLFVTISAAAGIPHVPRWAMGGDVGTTPQCPMKAASLLSTSPAMSPKPDIMTGCPQRPRLSELRSATSAILTSLPPPEKPTYCRLRQHEPRLATISSAQVLQARACSRIAKGRRLRSSPLRSEPAVPTSPASYPVASTPVLLEAEAINSQDICFTPLDLGMWAIFCDSLIGNQHTRDRHSNDALLCLHADSATALMDSRHLALALLAKLA